ncbi:MAG: heat-inducible transcriptional repressor HrcA [Acidobacteriota bacterium]|nr:heat-inducible transcriptional repressor HrcA [Acidobacteriota bacterium]
MVINARARTVLSQVVTLHYTTCEPVGSKSISRTRAVSCSPATIRNILGRLESSGYLSQPHTSAGRLPTDLGYRTYVNDISLSAAPLEDDEKQALDEAIDRASTGPALLKLIADIIHQRTRQMTFHIPFRHSGVKLRHLHLERLNDKKVLALWVGRGGQTFQSVLDIGAAQLGVNLAEKAKNYFNNAFRDCSLLDIQRALVARMRGVGQSDLLSARAALVVNALVGEADQLTDLSFQGLSRVLEMPEFQDVAAVKLLFEVVESQGKIKRVLRRGIEVDPLTVFFIGGEMEDPDLEELTIAMAKINRGNHIIGCVGVLGPKRMPYLKSWQMLSYAENRAARLPA